MKRAERRRRLTIVYRVVIALVILAGAVITGLKDSGVWAAVPKWLLPVLLVTVAVSAFRDNVLAAIIKSRAPEKQARRGEAQMALIRLLADIAHERKVEFLDLGASVFAIRPGPRWLPQELRERWSWSQPHLERTMRVRVADTPQASDVRWTKGKGAIGTCWAHDKPVYKNWLPIAKKHGLKDVDEQTFSDMRPDVHSGMTLHEFRSIAPKYAEIKAVPIKNEEGQIVGVLSVDVAARNRLEVDGRVLDQRILEPPAVEELITTTAKFIEKSRVTE